MVIPVFYVEEMLQTNSCQGSQFTLKVFITYELRSINNQLTWEKNLCRLNMFLQLALHVRYLCETQGNVTNVRNIGKKISEHLNKKKYISRGKKLSILCHSYL